MRRCGKCGGRSRVTETRERAGTVWRRRECLECQELWSTWESSINTEAVQNVAREITQLTLLLNDATRRLALVAREANKLFPRDDGQARTKEGLITLPKGKGG